MPISRGQEPRQLYQGGGIMNLAPRQEYMSDSEALADVQNSDTDTKPEHIRRDVNITVEEINLGAGSEL